MEQLVKKIVAGHLGMPVDDIQSNHKFIEDLGADSLDSVEIIMLIEEEFNIEIPDHEVEQMFTVASLINYVKSHV